MSSKTRSLVEVKEEHRPAYYLARVLDVRDSYYLVHYEGFESAGVSRPEQDNVLGRTGNLMGPDGPVDAKDHEYVFWNRVRRLPTPDSNFSKGKKPDVGETVEIQCKASDDEPFSWWEAQVKSVKGDYCHVRYFGDGEDAYEEIVELERVRPSFRGKPVCEIPKLIRAEVAAERVLVDEILEQHGGVENGRIAFSNEIDMDIGAKSGAVRVWIELDQSQTGGPRSAPTNFRVVIVGEPKKVERCKLLVEPYIKGKHRVRQVARETEKLSNLYHEMEKQKADGAGPPGARSSTRAIEPSRGQFIEVFQVPCDLLGLLIGQKGFRVKQAQAVQGVDRIQIDDDGRVSILGTSQEGVREARSQFELLQVRIPIETEQIGWLIGKEGRTIREIQDKSGVMRIEFANPTPQDPRRRRPSSPDGDGQDGDDHQDANDADRPSDDEEGDLRHGRGDDSTRGAVVVVGTADAVEKAQLLIEQHTAHLCELEERIHSRSQLEEHLRNMWQENAGRRRGGGAAPPGMGGPQRGGRGGAGAGSAFAHQDLSRDSYGGPHRGGYFNDARDGQPSRGGSAASGSGGRWHEDTDPSWYARGDGGRGQYQGGVDDGGSSGRLRGKGRQRRQDRDEDGGEFGRDGDGPNRGGGRQGRPQSAGRGGPAGRGSGRGTDGRLASADQMVNGPAPTPAGAVATTAPARPVSQPVRGGSSAGPAVAIPGPKPPATDPSRSAAARGQSEQSSQLLATAALTSSAAVRAPLATTSVSESGVLIAPDAGTSEPLPARASARGGPASGAPSARDIRRGMNPRRGGFKPAQSLLV